MTQQHVFVITGATGTGKTTVSDYLRDHYGMAKVITHTTRPPRPGERNGVDYFFETPASFATNHYLESVTYAGYQYGSSFEALQAGFKQADNLTIVLDTKGATTYARELGDQAIVFFLTVAEPAELQARLIARGDHQAARQQRLSSADFARDLQLPATLAGRAHVIQNDDWSLAKREIDQIVRPLLA